MDVPVPTSLGPSRLVVDAAAEPHAVLWLGHGAGGGVTAPDLAALAAALPARGVTVLRYEQPWRTAGKRVASRPATLDAAWLETAPVVAELAAGLPLLVGGRSAGARVACRTAAEVRAAGVVCLSFPLHPPGRPEKSRLDELLLPEVPVLVLQGERDTFGSAATVTAEVVAVHPTQPPRVAASGSASSLTSGPGPASSRVGPASSAARRIRVIEVAGADHGLKVLASAALTARDVQALLVDSVADFAAAVAR